MRRDHVTRAAVASRHKEQRRRSAASRVLPGEAVAQVGGPCPLRGSKRRRAAPLPRRPTRERFRRSAPAARRAGRVARRRSSVVEVQCAGVRAERTATGGSEPPVLLPWSGGGRTLSSAPVCTRAYGLSRSDGVSSSRERRYAFQARRGPPAGRAGHGRCAAAWTIGRRGRRPPFPPVPCGSR